MHFFFVFILVIGVAISGEGKTTEEWEKIVERLQQELNVLKRKFESNEVKIKTIENKTEKIEADTETLKANMNERNGNNTKERLSFLEDMIKLNVIRTCQEMLDFGIKTSNYYHIDPDGPLTGSQPFRVWCDFSQDGRAITEVLHNSEQAIKVEKCELPGCYKHDIVYTAPEDQIQALIRLSENCQQTIRYDCLMAPLMDDSINFGFWNNQQGYPQYYWDGSHHGEHVCSCFYQPEGCLQQKTCNCDAGVQEMKMDSGTITNKTALPIRSLQFGGLVYDLQQASHTLGRLQCWGKSAFEEGTSCAAIKRSGQFYNGFYNIRQNEDKHTQLVFCNMTTSPGYEDNSGQTYIESSETHFDLVEEDMEAIKSEIAMHSSFCGYRDRVTSTGTITYESLIFESNIIPGASFDLGSGRYTAGVKGTYRVDLAIGQMVSSYGRSNNDIYIQHNGANIQESNINSYIQTSSLAYDNGGRSMVLHLEKGDYVSVSVNHVYNIWFTTFCVSYVSA